MPSVNSKSVHEIKLNGGDLKRLSNGNSIEVDVGDSIIQLTSKAQDFEQDDTSLEDLEEVKEEADSEAEDGGDIVPDGFEERDVGGSGNRSDKQLTNDEVKVGNKEENLSGMVEKK
jgi:hypothetical protein